MKIEMEEKMNKVLPLTDLGNSERLLRDHSADVRYCPRMKIWLAWHGSRWIEDIGENSILSKAKMTVRSIPEEAKIDPSQRDAILKHAEKSETAGRINAMVKLARSAPEIQIGPEELDANPWLLNCLNGTLDLNTGNLLPHTREDFMTLIAGAEYQANAECPQFLEFLNEIMGRNQNMVEFLQRVFGYALTGTGREQCLFLFVGTGSNGKTTLIEALRKVLGGYARHTPAATVIQNNLQIRNDLARLKAVRFVTASEVSRNKELDEATAKMLTGEDPVTSRFLFKEFFEYRPSFKLFLLANQAPVIRGTDYGIWRRILLLPFPVTFSGVKIEKGLISRFEQELPGILYWAVQGCLKWQKDGLMVPNEVKDATQEYRREADILPQFLDDCCIAEKTARVASKKLFEAYKSWAVENEDEILKQKAFGTLLKTGGFKASKSNATRYWNGLQLKSIVSPSSEIVSEEPQLKPAEAASLPSKQDAVLFTKGSPALNN